MANDDDKRRNESPKTETGGAPPPRLPSAKPAGDDETPAGSGPAPAVQKSPGTDDDTTQIGILPPPAVPGRPESPVPSPPSAPAASSAPSKTSDRSGAAEDTDRTVVGSAADRPDPNATVLPGADQGPPLARLVHLQPKAHFVVRELELDWYTIGRDPKCGIRLWTDTASRMHATLRHDDGRWRLFPEPGKSVLVNSERVGGETTLTLPAQLQFGGDVLKLTGFSGDDIDLREEEEASKVDWRVVVGAGILSAAIVVAVLWFSGVIGG